MPEVAQHITTPTQRHLPANHVETASCVVQGSSRHVHGVADLVSFMSLRVHVFGGLTKC